MPHRVLVVDDEESVRSLIRDYLRGRGYVVGSAVDGVKGIEAFEAGRPHLVIIDFLLPKKNGFAVAEAIRGSEQGDRTQLVMMSGVFKNPKTAVEAREKYQVLEFLGKPVDLEYLGRLVDDALSLIPEDDDAPDFGDKVESRPVSEGGVGAATLSDTGVIYTGGSRPFPPLPPEGSLEVVPVAQVLSTARYDRLTGMIDLTEQGVHRRVYLLGGQPVFMQSNADGENVGALLLRRGRITEPDFERCLSFMKREKKTLQQALLELKLATEQELATAYKLLAGQLLPMAVGMSQGTFHWRETDAFVGRVPEGQFDAVKVIFDGIKRYVHPPQILRFFQGREDEPLKRSPEFERMLSAFRRSFSADNVASLVDDRASYRSITRARSDDPATVAPQLFALVTTGMCALPGSPAASTSSGAAGQADDFNLSFSDGPVKSSSARFGSSLTESPGTAEDRQARARVNQACDDYLSRNFFEIFDLPTGTDVPEDRLRSAYFALAKQWHEDAFVGMNLRMSKHRLDELFARIKEAYDTLVNKEKRTEYLLYIERQRRGLPTDIQQIFRAEQIFDDALMLLKRRDLAGARARIEEAIQLNPGEAIFFAYKGWVTFLADKDAKDDAVNLIRRAVAEQENLPIGYQFLGQIGAAVGDMSEARKWFNKCLEYDPNNIEAARGIRMINTRDSKAPESRSGISGVFGRLRKK